MTIEPAVAVVLINLLTTLAKRYIVPKWGATGVQVIVALLALIAAWYLQYGGSLEMYVAAAGSYFALAIALYEVLWKRIDIKKLMK